MKTILLSVVFAAIAVSAPAAIRKWTSADDASKSFEGELTGVKAEKATIKMKNGQAVTVPSEESGGPGFHYGAGQGEGGGCGCLGEC